jgi:hypothetical protein
MAHTKLRVCTTCRRHQQWRVTSFPLLEVVYNEPCEERLTLFHEFHVLGMILVFVLSLFALELNVQRHLVGLIDNVAMTSHHLTNVEIHNARDRRQVFLGRSDQLISGVRLTGVGPKDNYM